MRAIGTAYRGCSPATRAHALGRALLCPFERLASFVPEGEVHLDVGAGFGVFCLALSRRRSFRRIVGLDPDPRKIAQAYRARFDPRIEMRLGRVEDLAESGFSSISLFDVLYLLPDHAQRPLLEACVARLRPGGMLLVKELGRGRPWQRALAYAEEFLAVRVLRFTQGRDIRLFGAEGVARTLESLGLHVAAIDLGRGYPHPHVLLAARRNFPP